MKYTDEDVRALIKAVKHLRVAAELLTWARHYEDGEIGKQAMELSQKALKPFQEKP